jgi:hypothetical protein
LLLLFVVVVVVTVPCLHPLIYWDVAQRNSRNQPRGTLIVKSRSVDKVVYGDWREIVHVG